MGRGKVAAQRLMDECGVESISEFPLELLAASRGATIVEKPLNGSDGRIVMMDDWCIITINSGIPYEAKRRFTLAHEIGHLEMHRDHFLTHHDNDATLEYFKDGHQETEANEFASELLMPEKQFIQECSHRPFSPDLLRELADTFGTSISSVAYKYYELGPHPICLVYSYNNVVKYWKRKDDYSHFIKDRSKLAPPENSVASEWFDTGTIYPRSESKQHVDKSTWFELKETWEGMEDDADFQFWEYAIVTQNYNTVLSVIWED